jgi:hypothetical protein
MRNEIKQRNKIFYIELLPDYFSRTQFEYQSNPGEETAFEKLTNAVMNISHSQLFCTLLRSTYGSSPKGNNFDTLKLANYIALVRSNIYLAHIQIRVHGMQVHVTHITHQCPSIT